MAFLNEMAETAGLHFIKLLQDDSDESENDSGSVASDTNENDLVQYDQPLWIENEVQSEEETFQGDEADYCDLNEEIHTLKSKDGSITWFTKPFEVKPPRFIKQQGGYPNGTVNPQTIKESFEMFFNIGIKNLILTHTNENGVRMYKDKWKHIDSTELDAIVGLLILAGVLKSKGQDTRELWEESTGIPRFRATISYNRYKDILRCMKFDDGKTREERKKTNPLAPVSEFLEIFSHCCKSSYVPSMEITVGQQLYPWRGKSEHVKVYLPTKPGKFGLKFWTATDALNSYCINIQLYCSKPNNLSSEEQQTKEVIDTLCCHLYNQNRNFTFDGIYVDYQLTMDLLKEETYTLGTMHKTKSEIPPEMIQDKKRKIGSCLFGFTNQVTICSHVPKKHSSLIFMSSAHHDKNLDIIRDYNRTKVGVDNLDKLLGIYSVKCKTKRWPMVVFYNTLDIACYNALIIWLSLNPTWNTGKHKRRTFLKQLAIELTQPQIQIRAATPSLHRSTKRAIEDSGFTLLKLVYTEDPLGTCKRKRCHICPRSIDRKSQVTCHECNLPVCKEHSNTTVVCRTCLQTEEFPGNDL